MDDPAAHARQARAARAAILRELGDGTRSLRITLRTPPSDLKTCKILTVLMATRNMGPVGSRKVLESCAIWPGTTLGNINSESRKAIIHYLPKRAK